MLGGELLMMDDGPLGCIVYSAVSRDKGLNDGGACRQDKGPYEIVVANQKSARRRKGDRKQNAYEYVCFKRSDAGGVV